MIFTDLFQVLYLGSSMTNLFLVDCVFILHTPALRYKLTLYEISVFSLVVCPYVYFTILRVFFGLPVFRRLFESFRNRAAER